ncbi:MAG: 50S ribosomal protein L4 [Ignavibacteriales bacterium]|nr:50S ribosomal protein L4 [Ignavibacteriales bacterium]
MKLDVLKKDGTKNGETIELKPDIFEIEPNDHAIYQAVRSYWANQRQGTHKVKARNEVRGGGKKPFSQKKTGRARQGTGRSPLMPGGGSIFGPTPHDYVVKLPIKVKRLARKSAWSYKAKDGQIVIVEDFSLDAPKTQEMVSILKALQVNQKKVLLLTSATDMNMLKSGRNIPTLNVLEAAKASTYDILNNNVVVLTKSSVDVINKTFAN